MVDPQHYDLLIIGSGSGNSLLDSRFDHLRVAMVDHSERYGGTCLNVGCIPTKMFVLPADHAIHPHEAARLGVTQHTSAVDFPAIQDRIFSRIDAISDGGLAWREQQPHVDVHRESAHFLDAHTIELAPSGRRLSAERIVLAAGSRPRPLDVPIADEVADRVHTSDTIMRIPELPRRLVILGAGFVAAEFGHIFSAYGSRVTMVNRSDNVLRSEDRDISSRVQQLASRRMEFALGQQVQRLDQAPDGSVRVSVVDDQARSCHYDADVVLNAIGRVPNGDRLNLAAAGVETDARGFVRVDEHQRTTVSHIWALGDVCSPAMLKHVANHEMRVVQHNLLHPDEPVKANHRHIPHAVFTDPQVGSVGLTEQEAEQSGRPYLVTVQDYATVAYGWAMEDEGHFAKLIADPLTGLLLGAHVVGPQAATLVQQLVQMMSFGQTIETMARDQYWIHPALPEVLENALLGLVEHRRTWLEEHAVGPGVDR